MDDIILFSKNLISQYGLWAVFIGLFLENTLFLGLFIPGTFILLVAGFFITTDQIYLYILCAILGTLLGDTVSFWGGYFWGTKVYSINDKIKHDFQKKWWMILFFHHSPITRIAIPAFYGNTMQFSFIKWILIDLFSATLFVCTYIALGYISNQEKLDIIFFYNKYNIYINICIFVFSSIWLFFILNLKKQINTEDLDKDLMNSNDHSRKKIHSRNHKKKRNR